MENMKSINICQFVLVFCNPHQDSSGEIIGGEKYEKITQSDLIVQKEFSKQIYLEGAIGFDLDKSAEGGKLGFFVTKGVTKKQFIESVVDRLTRNGVLFLYDEYSKLDTSKLSKIRKKGGKITKDIFKK